MNKYAVVLFNLGGPDSLEAVEPFLFNLFSDGDIFKIPFGQKLFAKIMSRLRAPHVKEKYEQIGGKSPLNKWTKLQRSMLQTELQQVLSGIEVYTAMRYWHPTIEAIIEKISATPFDQIALIPLYPHYSLTTTGSAFNEWRRHYKGDTGKLVYVYDYFENSNYISALNERIDESIERFPKEVRASVQIVFSAHGIPESLVKKGDPYPKQITNTAECVMEARNYSHEYHLCFQSKVGPARWLKPSTDDMIKRLATEKKRQLLMVPVSFVSDHIETSFELDIEYRSIADKADIENYVVMNGLNDSKIFIAALKELAVQALQKKQIVNNGKKQN